MSEWRHFDTEAFLKASRFWDEKIKELETELSNMSGLPAVNNESGIRGSDISDMTAQMALRRLKITAQIEDIKLDKEILKYALKMLSEEESELINGFFFPKKAIGTFVWEYSRKYAMSERKVYEERKRVLRKMGDLIEEEFYEE